jgi:hypothetical protein
MRDYKFLNGILKYPTEGEDDDLFNIDLDQVLNTGVGSDYKKVDNQPTDDEKKKAEEVAAIKLAEEEKKKKELENQNNNQNQDDDLDTLTLIQGLSSDTLDADQKELKNDILTKFKGVGIDANGNVIDKNNNVVANFSKVEEYLNADPLYDDKGNQIDEKGKVVKTKAQVEFEKSAIAGVIAELPYELKDDKGNPIIYDDTLEGWKKLGKDIGRIEAETQYQSLLESNPELTEIAKHILSGGKIEDFNKPIDYSKIETKKLSTNDKLDLIKRSFVASGVDSDSAADMMDLIKEKGEAEIDKRLSKAISTLDNNQKEIQAERDAAYQRTIQEENNRVIKYWTGVKQVVDKGTLGNVEIPKEDQEAFFKYLSTPVDEEGNSQETLDNMKQGLESDLMMRYYRYKGYNLEKIVNREKNRDKVLTLREKINKARKSNSSDRTNTSSSSRSGNPGDVSLDELLGN